jgi:hypothetical protein
MLYQLISALQEVHSEYDEFLDIEEYIFFTSFNHIILKKEEYKNINNKIRVNLYKILNIWINAIQNKDNTIINESIANIKKLMSNS